MPRKTWSALAAFALAAFVAGCGGGTRMLASFPAQTPQTAQNGAILFKLKVTQDIAPGMSLNSLILRVFPKEGSQIYGRHDLNGRQAGEDQVILISVPPGRYNISPALYVMGNQGHVIHLDNPGGAFADVLVESGKVAVPGALDLLAKIEITSVDGGGQTFTWKNAKTRWDDRPPTRAEVLKEALADARADKRKWTDAIRATQKELEDQ